jgi:hypothetical protein
MNGASDVRLDLGLVHYYEAEEASGTRVDDVGSADFTAGGTVPSGTGKFGNGASVSVGNYLSVPTPDFLPTTFTIGFWINISGDSGSPGLGHQMQLFALTLRDQ